MTFDDKATGTYTVKFEGHEPITIQVREDIETIRDVVLDAYLEMKGDDIAWRQALAHAVLTDNRAEIDRLSLTLDHFVILSGSETDKNIVVSERPQTPTTKVM